MRREIAEPHDHPLATFGLVGPVAEVDIIIERPDGWVIAIEVKSATTTNQADARGLRFLSDRLGGRMLAGLLLHTGARQHGNSRK